MFYIIAYDIPDDKRRTKVANLIEGYGFRAEMSVFEAKLDKTDFIFLKAALVKLLDIEKDKLYIYPLCVACEKDIIRLAGAPPPHDDAAFIV